MMNTIFEAKNGYVIASVMLKTFIYYTMGANAHQVLASSQ